MYTVYQNPRDFPGKFVVRRFRVSKDGVVPELKPWAVKDSLEEVHKELPPHLFKTRRMPEDESHIVEVWL